MLNIHFLTEQTAREPIFGGFSPLNFRKRWCLHLVDKVLYDGFLQRKTKCKNRSKKIRITFMLKTLSVIPKWFSSCRFSPLLSSTLTHKVTRGAKRKWILNEIKTSSPVLKPRVEMTSRLNFTSLSKFIWKKDSVKRRIFLSTAKMHFCTNIING